MCLTTVTNKYKKNDRLEIGYKRFRRGFFGSGYQLEDLMQYQKRKIGYLYHAIGTTIMSSQYINADAPWNRRRHVEYDSGFHFYTSLKDALGGVAKTWNDYNTSMHIICEVAIWDIRAAGTQGDNEVLVGKHMRVIRPITRTEFESGKNP